MQGAKRLFTSGLRQKLGNSAENIHDGVLFP